MYGEGLRPIACSGCEFESRRRHGCLVYCTVKDNETNQNDQDKEISTGKVQRENKRRDSGNKKEKLRIGTKLSAPTHPASYKTGTGSFPGVKRPEHGVNHPPPSSAEVKERVELYLHSLSGPSWPVLGRTLPLPFTVPIEA